MTEDASLDAFAEAEADDGSADAEEAPSTDAETVDSEFDTSATDSGSSTTETVEPARSTYAWSPEGGECADCGASVARRWRRDGQKDGDLVCSDCKEW